MEETHSPRFVRFGTFEVDLQAGELRKGGLKLKFTGQPFQVLAILLERPNEVVTREQLQKQLWPDGTFVDFDHNLNTAINKIREVLGDSAENPRFVETLPRRGYRFIAPISDPRPHARALSVSVASVEPSAIAKPSRSWAWYASVSLGFAILLIAAVILLLRRDRTDPPATSAWVQLTNFADSATSPALSSDGRMIAFIRGPETFVTPGQIYIKLLPDGQPIPLTHDNLPKMAPVFSSDGSRIAYTATDASFGWNTWVVPVLGGEPREILLNAAALTWADRQHVLFSEIKSGIHMALVTAEENRAGEHDVYVPAKEGGMAHRSWRSPDGKRVLVSEMDSGEWQPCRVLPLDGSSVGETVGPEAAACTYAGWSPDGKWMYLSADAGNGFHVWRQRFPHGPPEQLTFGPTEEEGITVAPDGRSLVTSAGIRHSSVWLDDARGDRQISSEGYATVPGLGYAGPGVHSVFSSDGKKLFHLVHTEASRPPGELWIADLESGRSETVFPSVLLSNFDLAPDGKRVAYSSLNTEGSLRVWIASLDGRASPQQITSFEADRPSFGATGTLFFHGREGNSDIVYIVKPNETMPRRINAYLTTVPPGWDGRGVESPDGQWLITGNRELTAQPAQGGPKIHICDFCGVGWGPSGKYFYVRLRDVGVMGGGKVYAIALPTGKSLPAFPPSGIKSAEDFKGLSVVSVIDTTGVSIFAPGPNPSVYAYSRMTVQRNLFRIPLN